MPELKIDNFRLGQRRDGALREDRLFSMRSLINYDIVYSDGRLRVRKGFSRFNDTALAAPATQIYPFVDMDGNEHLLGILDTSTLPGDFDKWYEIMESGAHNIIHNAGASAPRPAFSLGNRFFFGINAGGTTPGLRWTDDTALAAATKSYQVGINVPTGTPLVERVASLNHPVPVTLAPIQLNITQQYRIAIKLVVASTLRVGGMYISIGRPFPGADVSGGFKLSIYNDDGGEPDSDLATPNVGLVDPGAVSNFYPLVHLTQGVYGAQLIPFRTAFELTPGTYWAVVDSDESYRDHFDAVFFNLGFENNADLSVTTTLRYSTFTSLWIDMNLAIQFTLAGLDTDLFYDYVMTYSNSTYGSESRPSGYVRIDPTAALSTVEITLPTVADAQVDTIRIYRREVVNIDDADADVVDTYKYVGEGAEGDVITDTMITSALGADLQTQDHFTYMETDDTGEEVRTASLLPAVGTVWKGRIWFAEADGNILYFSKILEEDGATGLTGDFIPDYFPLDNKLELPAASGIIAIKSLSQDQLAVYLADESIWVITGANEILNPPSDIRMEEVLTDGGLIGTRALSSMFGKHVYLSRDGLRSFGGSAMGLPGVSSETNQTILDDIQSQYLDDSIIAVFGTEIWVLVDADNDGDLETIMILDLERDLPTRQIFDRLWRMYDYGTTLNDIVVRRTASEFRTMLAADAENAYILELGTGTTDNGRAIVAELETHDLPMADAVSVHQVDLKAKYPGTASSYRVTLTDHNGDAKDFSLSPNSSEDVRGHRTGCRFKEPVSMRVKVVQRAVAQNELRSLALTFTTRG